MERPGSHILLISPGHSSHPRGTVVEMGQMFLKPGVLMPEIGYLQYAAGFFFSFGVGYFALLLLKRLAAKQQFMYFVWYCLGIGIFSVFYFNF